MEIPFSVFNNGSKPENIDLVFQVNRAVSPYDLLDIAPNNYSKEHYNYKIQNLTSVKEHSTIPNNFTLEQNYPNPFNGYTILKYNIPNRANVKIEIFNAVGQKVTILTNSIQDKGSHSIAFNSINLTSGVYFYRMQFGEKSITRKMVLLK